MRFYRRLVFISFVIIIYLGGFLNKLESGKMEKRALRASVYFCLSVFFMSIWESKSVSNVM